MSSSKPSVQNMLSKVGSNTTADKANSE